jgi:hypothetical protein
MRSHATASPLSPRCPLVRTVSPPQSRRRPALLHPPRRREIPAPLRPDSAAPRANRWPRRPPGRTLLWRSPRPLTARARACPARTTACGQTTAPTSARFKACRPSSATHACAATHARRFFSSVLGVPTGHPSAHFATPSGAPDIFLVDVKSSRALFFPFPSSPSTTHSGRRLALCAGSGGAPRRGTAHRAHRATFPSSELRRAGGAPPPNPSSW